MRFINRKNIASLPLSLLKYFRKISYDSLFLKIGENQFTDQGQGNTKNMRLPFYYYGEIRDKPTKKELHIPCLSDNLSAHGLRTHGDRICAEATTPIFQMLVAQNFLILRYLIINIANDS